MKILILNPPRRDKIVMVKEGRCMQRKGAWNYVMSPVTMVTIGTLLRNEGYTVKVIDSGVDANDFNKLLKIVKDFKPDIVLINTSTTTIDDDMYTSKFLKLNYNKNIKTILFGIHTSVKYEDILNSNNMIDFCIIGEPEITIKELISCIKDNNCNYKSIEGIAFKDSNKIIRTPDRKVIENLDILPKPDWSLVNTDNYRLPFTNEKFLLVNTNRGCPYKCIFCNAYVYYGRRHRHHSVEYIVEELKQNVYKFGVRNFMMWAEEFILDKKFVQELSKAIIKENLNIKWVCNSRVDAVDLETLELVHKAGCWNIAYGIESGVQEILDKLKKQITLEQIRKAVSMAHKAGLQVTGHVIIGFPWDTIETMHQTEKFVNSLNLDFVQYYCAMPYPGTELYDMAIKNNWINTNDWSKWEHNYSVLDYPHLKSTEIMKLRTKFFRNFYFKPRTVLRTVKRHIKKPKHFLVFIKNIKEFLRWI